MRYIPERFRNAFTEHMEREFHGKGFLVVDGASIANVMPMEEINHTNPIGVFRLSCTEAVTALFWSRQFMYLTEAMRRGDHFVILGPVRDQRRHLLCWAYTSTDMVSATRVRRGLTANYCPLSAWCLCRRCAPQLLGTSAAAEPGHECYGLNGLAAFRHMQSLGVAIETDGEEEREFFCTEDFPAPPLDMGVRSVKSVQTIEEALRYIHKYPVCATVIAYKELYKTGSHIYSGPTKPGSKSYGYHMVSIGAVTYIENEPVALCKLSNGTEVGVNGIVAISLATMFMVTDVKEEGTCIRPFSKPRSLLTDLIVLDIDEEDEKELEKRQRDRKRKQRDWEGEEEEEEPERKRRCLVNLQGDTSVWNDPMDIDDDLTGKMEKTMLPEPEGFSTEACSSGRVAEEGTDLVPAYVRLLRDNEAEVRIAAAGKVAELCRILNPELAIQHILPCVKELSSDSSQHVRSALASVIMGLAPVLGKDATAEHLLPIFLSLLKDEFPDVRLNIISKLDQVNQVIGIDLLSQSLLPAIVELAEDRHWRVRLAIIEYIPLLASQLGVGFFDDKLGALCMQWLQDKVLSIRDAAANNLKRLAEEFGPEWAMQHIVPQVLEMINNPHYLYRMTILRAVSLLAPVMGSEITCTKLLPVVITASKDRVPNIKFNVAKMMQSLIPVVDQSVVENMIRPCVVELSADPDVDVRFFANQALQSIDNAMMSS